MNREAAARSATLDIRLEQGVVWLQVRGTISEAFSAGAVAQAVRWAREAGSELVLFDIRGANHPAYHSSVLKRAENAVHSGIASLKVAIVGEPGSALLKFIDNVVANRGLRARSFTDEAKALKWLASPR